MVFIADTKGMTAHCFRLDSGIFDYTFQGAFFGLVLGMLVGLARFIAEYSYGKWSCGDAEPDSTPALIKNFHYLYFSLFLFVLTGLVAAVVSVLTKPIDERCVSIK